MALTHLLAPIRINKLEIKNRILRTGHGTYYGKGSVSEDLIAYHEARARSGVGLTTLEVTCVHRSSVNNTLFGWDDDIIPGFREISSRMHQYGMKLFTQLWHGGQHWPCGWLKDKFGVTWQVTPKALLEMTKDEDTKRVGNMTVAMMKMKKLDIAALKAAFEEDN